MNALVFKSKSWWKSEWSLLRDEHEIGEFVATKKFTLAEARAKAESFEWTLASQGWGYNKLIATDASGAIVATTTPIGWWGSKVIIETGGKKYTLQSGNWYWSRYVIKDEADHEVLAVTMRWWKMAAEVHVSNYAVDNATIYLLAFLAFYRAKIIEMQSSAAASSGAIIATTGS